jgi:hypothetical protein
MDYLEVTVDGTQQLYIDTTSLLCGNDSYVQRSVDVSAYADGAPHSIVLHSEVFGANGGITNIYVDRVSLIACGGVGGAGTGGAGGGDPCEHIADGSFENGSPNSDWAEESTNYGTPLCDSDCTNGQNLASDGEWWAWFGGIADYEDSSLSQQVVIPPGANVLTFLLSMPLCD